MQRANKILTRKCVSCLYYEHFIHVHAFNDLPPRNFLIFRLYLNLNGHNELLCFKTYVS